MPGAWSTCRNAWMCLVVRKPLLTNNYEHEQHWFRSLFNAHPLRSGLLRVDGLLHREIALPKTLGLWNATVVWCSSAGQIRNLLLPGRPGESRDLVIGFPG